MPVSKMARVGNQYPVTVLFEDPRAVEKLNQIALDREWSRAKVIAKIVLGQLDPIRLDPPQGDQAAA